MHSSKIRWREGRKKKIKIRYLSTYLIPPQSLTEICRAISHKCKRLRDSSRWIHVIIQVYIWPFRLYHRSTVSIFVRDYRRLVYRILIRIPSRAQCPKIRSGLCNGNKKRILRRRDEDSSRSANTQSSQRFGYRENGILVDNPESLDSISPSNIYIYFIFSNSFHQWIMDFY